MRIKHLNVFLIVLFLLTMFASQPAQAQKKKKEKEKNKKQKELLESLQTNDSDVKKLELESLFIEAFNQKMLGNTPDAIGIYQAIIKLDNKNHAAYYELNRIFYEIGDLAKAAEYGEKAIALYSKNEWYYIYLSETRAKMGDYQGAALVYKKLIDNIDDSYDYYFDWAYMLTNAGKLKEAVGVYDLLEKQYGVSENFSLPKESLYLRMGDLKSAANELNKLIEIDSTNIQYHGALGELYEANNENELAIKSYETIVRLDSTSQEGLLALAGIYKKLGKEDKYQSTINKVFTSKNLDLDTKILLFIPYIEEVVSDSSKIEEALRLADLILEANPKDPKPYTAKGDVYYNSGNEELALDFYKQAVNIGECPSSVWYQVFQIMINLEKYNDIIEYADISKKSIGEEVLPFFYKGLACQQIKNLECAITEYNEAVTKAEVNSTLKAQIFSNLGDVYNDAKQYEKSDSAFEESLIIDPNNSYVLNNYSYYLSVRNEKLEIAKSMSKKSNLLVENSASFQDTYAWILYQMGQYQEAKTWIEKAIANMLANEKPILLDHYGDILYKLGDEKDAIKKWQQAIDAGGDKELLEEKIKNQSKDAKQ